MCVCGGLGHPTPRQAPFAGIKACRNAVTSQRDAQYFACGSSPLNTSKNSTGQGEERKIYRGKLIWP